MSIINYKTEISTYPLHDIKILIDRTKTEYIKETENQEKIETDIYEQVLEIENVQKQISDLEKQLNNEKVKLKKEKDKLNLVTTKKESTKDNLANLIQKKVALQIRAKTDIPNSDKHVYVVEQCVPYLLANDKNFTLESTEEMINDEIISKAHTCYIETTFKNWECPVGFTKLKELKLVNNEKVKFSADKCIKTMYYNNYYGRYLYNNGQYYQCRIDCTYEKLLKYDNVYVTIGKPIKISKCTR